MQVCNRKQSMLVCYHVVSGSKLGTSTRMIYTSHCGGFVHLFSFECRIVLYTYVTMCLLPCLSGTLQPLRYERREVFRHKTNCMFKSLYIGNH
jgi:hypothetical protein